jgi:hypothetical protein
MLLLLSTVVEPRAAQVTVAATLASRVATAIAARPWSGRQHAGQPGIRHLHGCRGLAVVEPGFVSMVEVVVVGESAFEAGQCGGPDVEGVRGLLKGQLLGCACRPKSPGVGCRARVLDVSHGLQWNAPSTNCDAISLPRLLAVALLTIFVIQFAASLTCFLYSFDYRSRTLSSTIRTLAGEQRCLLGDCAKRAHFLFTNQLVGAWRPSSTGPAALDHFLTFALMGKFTSVRLT